MSPTSKYRKLSVDSYTQWEPGVNAPSSGCGPATMAALAEYWSSVQGHASIPGFRHFGSKAAHINYLYSHHGGRPWGMGARGMVRGLRAYLRDCGVKESQGWKPSFRIFNDIEAYKNEIDAGRPVALKFDKWFHFRWSGTYAYDYHWVLGIGYDETRSGVSLIIQDNGTRYSDGSFAYGRERRLDYMANKKVITMVAMNIASTAAGL